MPISKKKGLKYAVELWKHVYDELTLDYTRMMQGEESEYGSVSIITIKDRMVKCWWHDKSPGWRLNIFGIQDCPCCRVAGTKDGEARIDCRRCPALEVWNCGDYNMDNYRNAPCQREDSPYNYLDNHYPSENWIKYLYHVQIILDGLKNEYDKVKSPDKNKS